MRTLFFDCGMGAAGDMLTAALLELVPDKENFIKELNSIGIPSVIFSSEATSKCGIKGTHVTVKVNGEEEHSHDHNHEHEHSHEHEHEKEHGHHHHSSMSDIENIINGLNISEKVKKDVINVYLLIAEAESNAHGVPVSDIHFHEVGTMDAIADITAVCMLMEKILPDKVVASPVHVGSGQVKCAHGILPVPAPATAYILKDVPIYGGSIRGELCTPTGAALLKYYVTDFGKMPVMRVKAIGYGMGKKDFDVANCVRVMLGESDDVEDSIIQLSCNIDDMTAEAIGFAKEQLMEQGALDVYSIPIQMKKSRPGTLLSIICDEDHKEQMISLIFKHTTTLGVRENKMSRYILSRNIETVHTKYGDVRKKIASGYGITKEKYEYEDVARIAREQDKSIYQILDELNE